MEDCTPGPPKAMRMTAGKWVGHVGEDAEKRRKPLATRKMLNAEHIRGPYMSNNAPNSKGAVKLMEVAMTKRLCTVFRLSSGPPSFCEAIKRELEIAAHPKMIPPQAKFWKQAAKTMTARGALGLVILLVFYVCVCVM